MSEKYNGSQPAPGFTGVGRVGQRKGILRAWDGTNYLATVQLIGSFKATLTGIPTARNIASAEMVVGRYVEVAMFDINNPKDAVVTGVYT